MRRALYLLLLLAFCFPERGSGQQKNDKLLHFGAGAVVGAGGAFIASELSGHNRFWTFAGAVGASLLAGLAKEAIDEKDYNGWDNADLAATVLGGVTAGVTIDLFTAKARKRRKASQASFNTPAFDPYSPVLAQKPMGFAPGHRGEERPVNIVRLPAF